MIKGWCLAYPAKCEWADCSTATLTDDLIFSPPGTAPAGTTIATSWEKIFTHKVAVAGCEPSCSVAQADCTTPLAAGEITVGASSTSFAITSNLATAESLTFCYTCLHGAQTISKAITVTAAIDCSGSLTEVFLDPSLIAYNAGGTG